MLSPGVGYYLLGVYFCPPSDNLQSPLLEWVCALVWYATVWSDWFGAFLGRVPATEVP